MSAETELYSALANASGVTAIAGTRIYPDSVPQEQALPSVAYSRTDTEFETTIHTSTPYAERATLEVFAMHADRAQADALAEACRSALGSAGFLILGRRAEFDPENEFRGTVLTVQHFQSL